MFAMNLNRFPTEDRCRHSVNPLSFAFQGCRGRKVTAAFDGGSITSNAGALLLRRIDRALGFFDRVASCFTDHRDSRLTEHSVRTLVAQRITGIALGYEDLNDHDELRRDPLPALLSGKLEGRRKGCAPLAGKSTLSRLEHAPAGGRPDRYRRIDHDPEKLQDVLAELFIDSWQGLPPERLVLDIDTTDDPVHGRQEGRFYHGARPAGGAVLPRWSGRPLPAASRCAKMVLKRLVDHLREEASTWKRLASSGSIWQSAAFKCTGRGRTGRWRTAGS